jgi:hypothetical protein
LIINFPGSKKAVVECFTAIQSILPHAIELICDEKSKTKVTHENLQKDFVMPSQTAAEASTKEKIIQKPFDTSTQVDLDSSRFSEVSDITDLLDKSSTSMEEVS